MDKGNHQGAAVIDAKEEEIYLPILQARLPAGEVDHLVEAMQRTVTEAKSTLKRMDPRK